MGNNSYLKVIIGDLEAEVSDPSELTISIDYSLEDPEDWQKKKSSESFDIEIPATLVNDKVSNTARKVEIEDLTDGEVFNNSRIALIECNSWELLVGKAFLKSAKHTTKPTSYTYNILGDNADWLVEMRDKTLYDFLQQITFEFSKDVITASWIFDGTDEALPYVFAPVRYRRPFGDYDTDLTSGVALSVPDDIDTLVDYLRPSLSKYFIIYWAFRSLGYKIQSNFFGTSFFRKQVMPWTWGNFLDSDGSRLDAHKFMAQTAESSLGKYILITEQDHNIFDKYIDFDVTNDSTNGSFDNNDDYSYDQVNNAMVWEYRTNKDFGLLDAHLSVIIDYNAKANKSGDFRLSVHWWKNSIVGDPLLDSLVVNINASIILRALDQGVTETFFNTIVSPGDKIYAKIFVHYFQSKIGGTYVSARVAAFQLNYFRIPLGGTITFTDYTNFQNYKFLDFFSGVIDEFDLSINTDSINKVVYIEPTHTYNLPEADEQREGYFVNDFKEWNGKEDLSKEFEIQKNADTDKESIIQYKDDTNDGILKLVQDRHTTVMTASKYVFPDRFQAGVKTRENRFFSRTMHYNVDQWKALGTGYNVGQTPQIVCIIPENVSNTSERESDNKFLPKSCYYKGLISGAGAWKYDGEVLQEYPCMFAVNYRPEGVADPVLSYSDELIDGTVVKGLFKRFFLQRFAITRNGQRYNTWFNLKNTDVANNLHREFISYTGQRWELIQIIGFKPLINESTKCLLYKWTPITQNDFNNSYPSSDSILSNTMTTSLDLKYSQLLGLVSDIPT